MLKNEIGTNAGRIWQYLEENGESNSKVLKKALKLTDAKLYMAIGWLYREGKVGLFEEGDEQVFFLIFE